MNFRDMPELGWGLGYPFALVLMAGSSLTLYLRVQEAGLALAMCRALIVLCVATDRGVARGAEDGDRRGGVGARARGRRTRRDALGQVDAERPHILVAFGPFERSGGARAPSGSRGCGSSPTGTCPGPPWWRPP